MKVIKKIGRYFLDGLIVVLKWILNGLEKI